MKRAMVIGLAACISMPAWGAPTLSGIGWLEGCWAAVGGEKGSGEQWMGPAGGTMIGMSRTVAKGKTVQYEFMRIVEKEKGKLAFIALPSGQAETSFELVRSDADTLVFEAKHHDFPQRVIYRRGAGGKLDARIEGKMDGKDAAMDFPMRRTACAAK
ncbi:MAG TPA: DUF6265 family protein [Telluria sp.]|nr:DUF6265 family protein [Telluria sp.]